MGSAGAHKIIYMRNNRHIGRDPACLGPGGELFTRFLRVRLHAKTRLAFHSNSWYNYDMVCRCGSTKLKAFHYSNLDYILNYSAGRWFLSDPRINHRYYNTQRPWHVSCFDCKSQWEEANFDPDVYSPKVTNTEIVLDLDHTLFHVEYYDKESDAIGSEFDFKFKVPQDPMYYFASKRPNLDEFVRRCCEKFAKISFFTSGVDWYAEELIKTLSIPKNKLGFVKSRADTYRARPLSFEWELMKPINNSLVLEDKPLVIDGYGNIVIKVSPYHSPAKERDSELLEVMKVFDKPESLLAPCDRLSGKVELRLRGLSLPFSDIPLSLAHEILTIPSASQEELDKLPITTRFYLPWLEVVNGHAVITFSDLNHSNYMRLMALINTQPKAKRLSKKKYEALFSARSASLFKKLRG
jgi:hypothetical protein